MTVTTGLMWGLLTLFLANIALLCWLAVMIALHGERRTLVGWLVKGTLALGIVLLVCDTQILRTFTTHHHIPIHPYQAIFPGLLVPYFWYLITRQSAVSGQARWMRDVGCRLLTCLAAVLVALCCAATIPELARLQPAYLQSVVWPFSRATLILWPPFLLLCGILTLLVLRGITAIPGSRVSGSADEVRQVRRLLQYITSGILLGSLLLWIVLIRDPLLESDIGKALLLGFALVVTYCVLQLGSLVIHFEIFTGHSMPRRDFRLYWRRAIGLSLPLCALMALSVVIKAKNIYVLLVLVLSASIALAIISARSYAARQRESASLRPFFKSWRLFDTLLLTAAPSDRLQEECAEIFQRLCTDLLHTEAGFLIATGAFAPFITVPLAHPRGAVPDSTPDLLPRGAQRGISACLALEPDRIDCVKWAVPLWKEEQLIGVLLLGGNRQHDVYTQEEITLAAASCALLLDQLAGTRKAQQLIDALRQKIADQQLIDLRPRRILHDEIANHLILALRQVHAAPAEGPELKNLALEQLQAILGEVGDLLAAMPKGLPSEIATLGLFAALRLMMEDYYQPEFDEVAWQVDNEAEAAARALPSPVAEVIYHAVREAVRNAAKHGRGGDPARALRLTIAARWREGLEVIVEDNGVGFRAAGQPFTGTHQGMAMHSAMLALYGGTLIPSSLPEHSTRITIFLPSAACRVVAVESV